MSELTDIEQLEGKTIESVKEFNWLFNDRILIRTKCGCTLILGGEIGGYRDSPEADINVFTSANLDLGEKLEAGLISKEDYEVLLKAREERQLKEKEFEQHNEYLRLKAKFEDG